jgi:hypothetical protein
VSTSSGVPVDIRDITVIPNYEFNISDLRQLRSVAANYVFGNLKGELGHLIGNPLWESFSCYELTEIMSQRDDAVFAEALNRLARCGITLKDVDCNVQRKANKRNRNPTVVNYSPILQQ